jgi:hypothetical protein
MLAFSMGTNLLLALCQSVMGVTHNCSLGCMNNASLNSKMILVIGETFDDAIIS